VIFTEFRVPVTELARFAGRTGDLGRQEFGYLRGAEGIEVHQRLQRGRGAEYRAEVPLKAVWEQNGKRLEITGRIDGVEQTPDGACLEEIKTTLLQDALPLDWKVHELQVQIYGWMWKQTQGPVRELRVRYAHPDPSVEVRDRILELDEEWVDRACSAWADLQEQLTQWREDRNTSLRSLDFPFADMRPGQEAMVREVFDTLQQGNRLLIEAPTGIGKTLAVLWPALRSLGAGQADRVLITTSRNSGKTVVMEALQRLEEAGARVHAIPLEARERICTWTGIPCDVGACPKAIGFFDRLPDALAALRTHLLWTREVWRDIADRHMLCPYAFQMLAAREADVLVGDMNYALSPGSRLEFLFTGDHRTLLLVDEAHHLPDRCRAMISADLPLAHFRATGGALPPDVQSELREPVRRVGREARALVREQEESQDPAVAYASPDRVGQACRNLLEALESTFAVTPAGDEDVRLDLHRFCASFCISLDHRQESHVTFQEGTVFRHVCLDASNWLSERMDAFSAVVMFSATLSPVEEFQHLVGLRPQDRRVALDSPFDPSRFPVRIDSSIPIVWRERTDAMYQKLTNLLVDFITAHAGRTLVFFPSYALMAEVAERFPAGDLWTGDLFVQPKGMQESDTDAFLKPFRSAKGVLTGFAVLGGALNEGIDLPGEALTAVAVVSIGLPSVSRENEWIRGWHQSQGREGFFLAYTLPGWIRVRQALGRVIRGPEDRGTGLLIDPRFNHPFYQEQLTSFEVSR